MNDDKNLPASRRENQERELHDSGRQAKSIIEKSLSNLSEAQLQSLASEAAREALRLEVKKREQEMDYSYGKKAAEDHIETFAMLEKGGKLTRQSVSSEIKTGAGKMRLESRSGATCFVASVAYEDPNHPDVIFLRGYRDRILCKSEYGRTCISWYWRNGPKLAKVVDKSTFRKSIARAVIAWIVGILRTVRF